MKKICSLLVLTFVLFLLTSTISVNADNKDAANITWKCKFSVSNGKASVLTDGSIKTCWSPDKASDTLQIAIPQNKTAGFIYLNWYYEPNSYEIITQDSNKNIIQKLNIRPDFKPLKELYELTPETKFITITSLTPGDKLSEILIYSEGKIPDNIEAWVQSSGKAELMVVSAHQDDEFIYMGGTIPYYSGEMNKNTVVLYMANCGVTRRYEALSGLWAVGMNNYPVFLRLKDVRTSTLEEGRDLWGEAITLQLLVENIRKFKPDVIVTHDINGEYGHGAHRFTSYAVKKAVEIASDSSQYPDSVHKYGTWQVKKLYIHLYEANEIEMNWKCPLNKYKGKSALEMARYGYSKHASQQSYYSVDDSGKYDNKKFGLIISTVGVDINKNDFFENISAATTEPVFYPTQSAFKAESPIASPSIKPSSTFNQHNTVPANTISPAPATTNTITQSHQTPTHCVSPGSSQIDTKKPVTSSETIPDNGSAITSQKINKQSSQKVNSSNANSFIIIIAIVSFLLIVCTIFTLLMHFKNKR